jgi:hypothetical protein
LFHARHLGPLNKFPLLGRQDGDFTTGFTCARRQRKASQHDGAATSKSE